MIGRGNGRNVPKLTIECEYCQAPFVVSCGERNRRFCSKSCASKARPRRTTRLRSSLCQTCRKEFSHYGDRIWFGRACYSKYMSTHRLGDANPAWKPLETLLCKNCGNEFSYNRCGMAADKQRGYCSKPCWDAYQKG